MRVDGEVDLLDREPVLDRKGRLRDQIRCARADDVRAEEPARLGIAEDLGEALRLPERERPTRGGEWEAADLNRDPFLLRLFLAKADVRDLRVRVDAVRRRVVVGRTAGVARDALD